MHGYIAVLPKWHKNLWKHSVSQFLDTVCLTKNLLA